LLSAIIASNFGSNPGTLSIISRKEVDLANFLEPAFSSRAFHPLLSSFAIMGRKARRGAVSLFRTGGEEFRAHPASPQTPKVTAVYHVHKRGK
jgi:hypothetical protein